MSERLSTAIIEHFEDMPDPRQQAKVLYTLSEIILTTICAIICGAEKHTDVQAARIPPLCTCSTHGQ
jgi:hypothetical protein